MLLVFHGGYTKRFLVCSFAAAVYVLGTFVACTTNAEYVIYNVTFRFCAKQTLHIMLECIASFFDMYTRLAWMHYLCLFWFLVLIFARGMHPLFWLTCMNLLLPQIAAVLYYGAVQILLHPFFQTSLGTFFSYARPMRTLCEHMRANSAGFW